jgi:glutamine amidotransferase
VVAIIDYGMGNLRSVQKAFELYEDNVIITNDPDAIASARSIVLPGVGACKDGIANLKTLGLIEILDEQVLLRKKPFLGICLGMQLICSKSYEFGEHEGLGWIDAEVVRFQSETQKIPHVGWNSVSYQKPSPLFQGIKDDSDFYFVHSYHVVCRQPETIIATTDYITSFASSVQKENIFACQFHPEKSQQSGLKLIENFLALERGHA